MEQKKSFLENLRKDREKYIVKPTQLFLGQLDELSPETIRVVEKKLEFLKINPFRNKRVKGHALFLFRIRFEDRHKEKRVVYLVDVPYVKVLFIIDRDKDYKDIDRFLRKVGL